jgi:hypothetical protein
MSKKKRIVKPEARQVAIGLFCKLIRPNMWAGFDCRVEAYGEGFHVVRVFRMDGTSFQVGAKFEELELK